MHSFASRTSQARPSGGRGWRRCRRLAKPATRARAVGARAPQAAVPWVAPARWRRRTRQGSLKDSFGSAWRNQVAGERRSGGANGSKSVLGFRWKWKRKWKVGAASGFRFSVTVFFCLFSTQTFLCPFSPICTVRSANGRWVFSKNYRKIL